MSTQLTTESETLLDELSDPVYFHPAFAKIAGSVTAGVLLSKAFSWSKNKAALERDGWFYKSWADWEEETGLTRREQQTARKHLRDAGLLEERDGSLPKQGRVMWFRVNRKELSEKLKAHVDSRAPRRPRSRTRRSGTQAPMVGKARPVAPQRPTPEHESARPVAPQRPTSLITATTTSEKTTGHTHTSAARAPSPLAATGEGDGVRVPDLSFEDYRDFARAKPSFTNPDAWAMKHYARRNADPLVREFLEERARLADGAAPAVDVSKCPDCEGRGMYYPEGFAKGAAKCRHLRLTSVA